MGVTNPVFPERWGIEPAGILLLAELHTTVRYKVNTVIMVWGKIEFQNKIRNSKI